MQAISLIIFTDEVGSTPRDLHLRGQNILKPRIELFQNQLKHLDGNGWRVLKSVGDALIITFRGSGGQTVRQTADAILALATAWKSRVALKSGSLRVAIHRPTTDCIEEGGMIFKALEREYTDRWPHIECLKNDLFGMEMNLAARLAGLPAGNAFLISKSVLDDTPGLEDELKTRLSKASLSLRLGPAIPVGRLKGFDESFGVGGVSVKDAKPCWIHEVLCEDTLCGHSPLVVDSRRFQVVRTVLANASTGKHFINDMTPYVRDVRHRANARLVDLMKDVHSGIAYYTDGLFQIKESWEGLPARLDRKADQGLKKSWLKMIREDNTLSTTHLLFTSSFDHATDELISDRIKKVTGSIQAKLTPKVKIHYKLLSESHFVHRRSCWETEVFDSSQGANATYYYLTFQIKRKAGIADDFAHFKALLTEDNPVQTMLKPVAWAMLRGGADGYVLYRSRNSSPESKAVAQAIETLCKKEPYDNKESFLARVLPLGFHELSKEWYQAEADLNERMHYDMDDWIRLMNAS